MSLIGHLEPRLQALQFGHANSQPQTLTLRDHKADQLFN